ncbi:MAG: hypothetical protein QX196_07935 [Methylococcaceae bacterium]
MYSFNSPKLFMVAHKGLLVEMWVTQITPERPGRFCKPARCNAGIFVPDEFPRRSVGARRNAIKLSTSWQDKPLAERSRSLQNRFDSAQRTA